MRVYMSLPELSPFSLRNKHKIGCELCRATHKTLHRSNTCAKTFTLSPLQISRNFQMCLTEIYVTKICVFQRVTIICSEN